MKTHDKFFFLRKKKLYLTSARNAPSVRRGSDFEFSTGWINSTSILPPRLLTISLKLLNSCIFFLTIALQMVLKRTIPLLVFLNKKNGYPLLLFSTQTNKKFVILSFAFSIPSNLNLDISKHKRGNLVLLTTISSSPLPLVLLLGYPHAWSFVPGARPTVQRRRF